jgi:ubiquinol-cytochrome c reductase subunit 7
MLGPLGPSLAPQIRSSRSLYAWVKPIANWYANVTGYRRMGLKYDDLCALLVDPNLLARLT